MRKVIFKNKVFYGLLIGYLTALLIYNLYATIVISNLYGLIPVIIQSTLLIFILVKNKYTKLFIQIWVIVALFGGSGFEVVADLIEGFENLKLNSFIFDLFQFAMGILILDYTRRTVFITSTKSQLEINDNAHFNVDLS